MPFSFRPNQVDSTQNTAQSVFSTSAQASIPIGGAPLSNRVDGLQKKNILQIILYILCGLMVFVTVSLFVYQRYLISRIASQKQVLDEEDKALGGLNLEGMRALSNRMKVVNQALNEHSSVNTAFLILEKSIENPVTYTRFGLTKGEGNKGYELQLGVSAPSYKAVAQQLDTLKGDIYKKDFIPNITFDGLVLDSTGKINLNFRMPILIQGKLPESVLPSLSSMINNFTNVNTNINVLNNATSSDNVASTTPN